MKAKLAQWIVKLASYQYGVGYRALCNRRYAKEERAAKRAIYITKTYFPIAEKLDKDAMLEQMCKEGWWG